MPRARADLPIDYSCAGCSRAAQMTNYLAQRFDREGLAEMSCIAGVGGNAGNVARVARCGRPILALDGCSLACASAPLYRTRTPYLATSTCANVIAPTLIRPRQKSCSRESEAWPMNRETQTGRSPTSSPDRLAKPSLFRPTGTAAAVAAEAARAS